LLAAWELWTGWTPSFPVWWLVEWEWVEEGMPVVWLAVPAPACLGTERCEEEEGVGGGGKEEGESPLACEVQQDKWITR
jgi:hypothetical protein